ncbi:putative manganese transporter [Paratractidigestivibacter faecalis]|uniref:putative manganese transporter n=1 Tax=Paratractidigestivibacter faecalis TaxID=2292441 RepID=UPI00388CF89F
MDFLVDVLTESVIDTLKLIPFLFLTYLAMEALEHSASHHVRAAVEKSGKAGPVVGSILGALPQCGFSAMAATLYAGRVVTAGTLVAVILSTSDEMIPVFVAHQESPARLFGILALKVIVGIIAGLLVDVALRMLHRTGDGHAHIHELCERAHCHCEDAEDESGSAEAEPEARAATAGEHDDVARRAHERAHGHDHHGHGPWPIVRSALVHTVQVTVFIFLVTFVFGLLIEGVGEDAIGELLADHPVRATFIAALVGLIPNCGASVALTELFLDGTLAAGPMVAGLLVSGGVGLLVLWRTNADLRQNAAVTGVVYAVGVAVGLLVGAAGMMF